jgi:Zn-dependent protease with chaperone function
MAVGKKLMNFVVKNNMLISFIVVCIFLLYLYLFFTFLLNYFSRKEGFTSKKHCNKNVKEEEEEEDIF